MNGSWERLRYDEKAYEQYIRESTGGLLYQLDPVKFYNASECRPAQPGMMGPGVSISQTSPLVDVESDLRGINRPQTHDPTKQYFPTPSNQYPALRHLGECGNTRDDTRISNPASNLRGTSTGQYAFQETFEDYTNQRFWNRNSYSNDRQSAKDDYDVGACTPATGLPPSALGMVSGLPDGQQTVQMPNCDGCMGNRCIFTDPLNPLYQNPPGSVNGPMHIQPALQQNYNQLMAYNQALAGVTAGQGNVAAYERSTGNTY